ncbi:Uncharacterised protein [Bordetella pertussis]|nr:Uncharacterised protein [Bordetella pertussis]
MPAIVAAGSRMPRATPCAPAAWPTCSPTPTACASAPISRLARRWTPCWPRLRNLYAMPVACVGGATNCWTSAPAICAWAPSSAPRCGRWGSIPAPCT